MNALVVRELQLKSNRNIECPHTERQLTLVKGGLSSGTVTWSLSFHPQGQKSPLELGVKYRCQRLFMLLPTSKHRNNVPSA